MKMENHEEILNALNDFEKKRGKIPPLLEQFLGQVARTGETLFPWPQLKPLFLTKLEQVMHQFNQEVPSDHLPLFPNVENVKFDEMRSRILSALEKFHGAPFTIQRLCELVTDPTRHYKHCDKFLRGIEKNVLVVSTVDPFGRKIVNESKHLVNGLDVNGHSLMNVEQGFSPLVNPPVSTLITDYTNQTEHQEEMPDYSNSGLKVDYTHGTGSGSSEKVVASVKTDIDRLDQVPVVCEFSDAHAESNDEQILHESDHLEKAPQTVHPEEPDPVSRLNNDVSDLNQDSKDQLEEAVPAESVDSSVKPEMAKNISESEKQSCDSDHNLNEEPVTASCQPDYSSSESLSQAREPNDQSHESSRETCEPDNSESVLQPCELDNRLGESDAQTCKPEQRLGYSIAEQDKLKHMKSESDSLPHEPDCSSTEFVETQCEPDQTSSVSETCSPDHKLSEPVAQPCEQDQRLNKIVAPPCEQGERSSEAMPHLCEQDQSSSELGAQPCESKPISSDLNLTACEIIQTEANVGKSEEEESVVKQDLGCETEAAGTVLASDSTDICTQNQTSEQDLNTCKVVVDDSKSFSSCGSDQVISSVELHSKNIPTESASSSDACEHDLHQAVSDEEVNIENQKVNASVADCMEVTCAEQNEEQIPGDGEQSVEENIEVTSASNVDDGEQTVQPMEED